MSVGLGVIERWFGASDSTLNAYMRAIRNNDTDALERLDAEGDLLEQPVLTLKMTPLTFAAKHNNLAAVEYLLDKGAAVDGRDGRGKTALHSTKNPSVIDLLLQMGRRSAWPPRPVTRLRR